MTTTVYLYDEIRAGDAAAFVQRLDGLQGPVAVRLNSPGGSVADGMAIYNAIKRHLGELTIFIDGLAASIASVIAMAGTRVVMAETALMMIHAPWVTAGGNAEELRQLADALDKHAEAMIAAYAAKSGKPAAAILKLMEAETWFTADEALAAGFCDEIAAPAEMAALMKFDLSKFKNPPRNQPMPNPNPNPNPAPVAKTPEEVLAAERKRREDIRFMARRLESREGMRELLDRLLDDPTITPERAGQMILAKLGEDATPTAHVSVGAGDDPRHSQFRAGVVDALLIRGGVRVAEPHPAARDLRGMSMADIAGTLLRQQGKRTEGMSRSERIQAALTTSDLPALLENVANKSVMTGFRENELATHRAWTRQGTLSDFKTAKRVAVSEAPGLEEVKEHAEYKNGAITDEAGETVKLATYGKILSVTRQALINDDLGELTRIPQALGQAAARKEADMAYAIITGNPTMRDAVALFHATHANLGTAAVLSVDSLGEARKLMRLQKGIGELAVLNIAPRFLIVPAALETEAEQLLATIQPTVASDVTPEWIRRLTVVVDARLDAASSTAWYLAADPQAIDTVEVLGLDGEPVSIETQNMFRMDGVEFKVRLDVAAVALDWRGLVKNAGA